MNKWATFTLAIHAIPNHGVFRRKGLIEQLSHALTKEQIDNYRLHVEQAGFIGKLGHGRYIKLKQIPLSLGWRECIRLAYPRRGKPIADHRDEE